MKRFLQFCCVLLVAISAVLPIHAQSAELHWYCTRQKAHRQMIAAPELRFVEDFGGVYIDHVHNEGNRDKVVYLTFDAGYENGNVEKILNTLKEAEVPAAFFVLEHLVTANKGLVRRMADEGHLVCNHTATHKNLSAASKETVKEELCRLERACEQAGVTTAPFFRPPEGSFSKELLQTVNELGYRTVFWSFAYADWDNQKQPSPDTAIRTVMDNIHNGAVLLLHPTSATNAEILPRVIDELKSEGYRFGTLRELCGL